jgi:hypothetical protein
MELLQGCAGLGWGGAVHGLVEIVNVCGSPALRACPMESLRFWGVGVWGSTTLAGQRSRAGGSEIPRCMEQRLHRPMEWGLVCSACYSFSIWWGGEASQEQRVQSADVSAVPDILPQSSKSPASYQVPGSRRSEGLWLCSGHHLGSSSGKHFNMTVITSTKLIIKSKSHKVSLADTNP